MLFTGQELNTPDRVPNSSPPFLGANQGRLLGTSTLRQCHTELSRDTGRETAPGLLGRNSSPKPWQTCEQCQDSTNSPERERSGAGKGKRIKKVGQDGAKELNSGKARVQWAEQECSPTKRTLPSWRTDDCGGFPLNCCRVLLKVKL